MPIPKQMEALVKPYGTKGLMHKTDASLPEMGEKDVLLQVLAASICGTDLHIWDDDPIFRDRIIDGRVTGHEFCGKIIGVGSQVKTLSIGDIVSAESHVACGSCFYCLNGAHHICQEVSAIGIDRPGGFAQYAVIPAENAILIPGNISPDVAACLEPFGNAVYTARYIDLVNKTVWVTGCGAQGLMALAVAKAAGARTVIATEPQEERQKLALQVLEYHSNPKEKNSDLVLNPNDPDLLIKIYNATDGLGVDVVLEMSGHPRAIEDSLIALRRGGYIIALGLSSSPKLEVEWNNNIVLKEATIKGIYGRLLYQTWTEISHLLASGKVNLEQLIWKERFSLAQYKDAFALLRTGKAAKVIFHPNGNPIKLLSNFE